MAATGVFLAVAAAYFWYLDRRLRSGTEIDDIKGDPRLVGYLLLRPLAILVSLLAAVVLLIGVVRSF